MTSSRIPKVTVYITNYNYGCYIEKAIESVLGQTHDDFELIVIDDGSTDNSREIINRYASHELVSIIFQQNKGLNVTNNIAVRAARGRFVMRLDADDYLDENALTVLAGVLDRNPDVGLVFPDYFIVDGNGAVLEVVRRHSFDEVTMLDQPAHGACTLIRRRCLLELGGYDTCFTCQDGYELWMRFIRRYTVQNVNLPLFYYRRHSQNLTSNEDRILTTRSRIIEKHAKQSGRELTAVVIVPVRGSHVDSASLPLRPLAGRPLIDWTLDTALEAKRVSHVIVTTPDTELLKSLAERYGDRVQTVKRDPSLARLNTYIESTVFHALAQYTPASGPPDVVIVLYIESPFRLSEHLDGAIDVMELFSADTVVAVRPELDPMYRHNGHGLESLRSGINLRLEREELYREVAQMRAVRRSFLEEGRKVWGGRTGHIIVDEIAAVRLRTELDWQIAEFQACKLPHLRRALE